MDISPIRSPDTTRPVAAQAAGLRSVPETRNQAVPSATPSKEQVVQAVENLQQTVRPRAANNLQFSIDDTTGRTVIRVVDAETGQTIRQIPSEEIVAVARNIERMQGVLVRQEA